MTDVVETLQALGFRSSHEQLNALLTHLTKSRASPIQTVEQIGELERREREVRNLASRTKQAALGTTKPCADYDWSYPKRVDQAVYVELSTLGFVRKKQNVLFRGPAGTGKTMLAKNLGVRALEAGMSVVFTNLSSALAELLRQESLPAVERRLRRYTAVDLLICDELGYQPIDSRSVDLLFQIISRRHETASTIITTNLPFKDWVNVFPGAACLVPLVDRFTENLVAFDMGADLAASGSLSEGDARQRCCRAVLESDASTGCCGMVAGLFVNAINEGLPVAVGINAAQLEQGLGALLDPAHAALIHAAVHECFDRALDLTGADFEVQPA